MRIKDGHTVSFIFCVSDAKRIRSIFNRIEYKHLYKGEPISSLILGVIKPIIETILQLLVAIFFTTISIVLSKREHLTRTNEETQNLKRERNEKRKQDKILRLTAKIKKIKQKDDE